MQPGTILKNRYQVVRQLGKGGFGEIFEVRDRGRPKVLKVLNLDRYPNPEEQQTAIGLFQREAKVLSLLRHSGIPKVAADGYFTETDGVSTRHYLVMEKIAGQTLAQWLHDRQTLAEAQAIDWLKQLCSILEYLHQQGYFHRDIKPSNIMLKPDGQLVLIDFGAVREVTGTYLAKLAEDLEITCLGSPGYTPREQYNGKAVPQSDFYSLSRTIVHLLTGINPQQMPVDPLTDKLIWQKNAPQVSPQLANLLDRLMASSPTDRPPNSKIIWEKLAELERTSSKIAAKPLVQDWLSGWTFKNRSLWVKLAVPGLLLLEFVGSLLSPPIASALNETGYQKYRSGELKTAELYFRLAVGFNSDLAMGYYNLGSACEDQQKFDCAYSGYRKAIQADAGRASLRAMNNLGRLYIIRDQEYDRAIALLKQGLSQTSEDKTKAALHKNLGLAYLKQGNFPEAETQLTRSLELKSDVHVPEVYCLLDRVRSPDREQPGDCRVGMASMAHQ